MQINVTESELNITTQNKNEKQKFSATIQLPLSADYMIWFSWKLCMLTHCGLVMPYGDIGLGQHWLR